jgi:hypothetical protein
MCQNGVVMSTARQRLNVIARFSKQPAEVSPDSSRAYDRQPRLGHAHPETSGVVAYD